MTWFLILCGVVFILFTPLGGAFVRAAIATALIAASIYALFWIAIVVGMAIAGDL
jgi:hypothetical protein